MSLSPAERETVVTFNDEDDFAEVFTHQRKVITKLRKNPAAKLIEEGAFETTRSARFEIPKDLVTFRTKRTSLTPKEKARRRALGRQNLENLVRN